MGEGDVRDPDPSAPTTDGPTASEAEAAAPLRDWTLATLHATLFVLLPLVVLLPGGGLGDLLGGLDTVVGLGLLCYLWLVLWLATRRALAAADPLTLRSALRAGVVWGAAAGVGFVGPILLLAGGFVSLTSGNLFFLPFVAGIGSLVACVVGALLGALFAALDLGLLALAGPLAAAGGHDGD